MINTLKTHNAPKFTNTNNDSVNEHLHVKTEAISADKSFFSKLARPFVAFMRYLSTPSAMLKNKIFTGNWLTTARVFDASEVDNDKFKIYMNIANWDEVKPELHRLMNSKDPFIRFIHVGCQKKVPHSSLIMLGRTKEGENFASFFDPQGGDPDKAKILGHQIPSSEIKSPTDLYTDLIYKTAFSEVPLKFSTSYIQSTHATCTAYSALFRKEASKAFEKENFSIDKVMKQVANRKFISDGDVRPLINGTRHL